MAYTDMSFPEFDAKFNCQEVCLDAIFEKRWPHGFICPVCGHNDGYRLKTRPVVECCVCKHQESITANTIFHKSKTSLRLWFLLLYEMAHDKGGASAMRLAKRFGMHRTQVQVMQKKIRTAMGTRDGNLTLAGYIELDEAFFGGRSQKIPGKAATAGKVQVLVLVESEGWQAGNLVMEVINSSSMSEIENVIANKVESDPGGQWIRSDGLGTHHIVMNHGHKIDMTPVPNALLDKYLRCVSLAISHAKRYFMGTYHHFCKKSIQRYLNEFCYRWNRRHLEKQLASHLIASCVLHPAISNKSFMQRTA